MTRLTGGVTLNPEQLQNGSQRPSGGFRGSTCECGIRVGVQKPEESESDPEEHDGQTVSPQQGQDVTAPPGLQLDHQQQEQPLPAAAGVESWSESVVQGDRGMRRGFNSGQACPDGRARS